MVTPTQWAVGLVAAAIGGVGVAVAVSGLPGVSGPAPEQDEPAPCIEPITMAAVGDVLLHGPLQAYAAQQPNGYYDVIQPVEDLLKGADVTIANLEGPAAAGVVSSGRAVPEPAGLYDGNVYKGYPMFNYHPSIIGDLQKVGVDVLQTANNHSLDRGSLGIDRTLDAMEKAKMPHTGTRHSAVPKGEHEWATTYTVKRGDDAYRFAFLSCTYGTNGLPDRKGQVLHCYEQRDELLAEVRKLHADQRNAAVVVMPHWGLEYQPVPETKQKALAQQLADAGATAIVGTHPHVVQPEAMLDARDGRKVPIVYSLGNFISNQKGLPRLATVIYLVGFTPTADGRLEGTMTGWIPLRMLKGAKRSIDPLDRLSPSEAAPYEAHLLETYDAANRLPADPKAYWNRSAKPVCAPAKAKPQR